MYKLKLKHHFDSAHKLDLNYDSPCGGIHGHRWVVIVRIWARSLNENGMICDFKSIKALINQFDHKYLNDLIDLNTTAENMSKYLKDEINKLDSFDKVSVEIFESPEASITYED